MKTITKSKTTLECLQEARKHNWNWDDFHRKGDYESVKNEALEEQGYECAYTGLWLGEGTKQKVQIDHFRKRSIYCDDAIFCWTNLFAAAKNLAYGADFKDEKIKGPKSEADRQYQTFWSPLQPNLAEAFWYRQDGTIEPDEKLSTADREMAERTIEMYNLNANDLRNRRKGFICQIRDMRDLATDNDIRAGMNQAGFSFLLDFELSQREN